MGAKAGSGQAAIRMVRAWTYDKPREYFELMRKQSAFLFGAAVAGVLGGRREGGLCRHLERAVRATLVVWSSPVGAGRPLSGFHFSMNAAPRQGVGVAAGRLAD